MKKIITHTNPDLDALAAVWVLKRFLIGWEEAEIGFAVAEGKVSQDDPETLYTDIGRGRLDHHQSKARSSATKKCFAFILRQRRNQPLGKLDQLALRRLVDLVTEIDNAGDMFWEEAKADRYLLYVHQIVDGLRRLEKTDREVADLGFIFLDTIFQNIKNKIRAEEELEKGVIFKSRWGKAIGVESGNRQILWFGEVAGFALVVTKDPEQGGVKIYARPDSKVDLSDTSKRLRILDPDSDWFLHASKRLLLNQSSVNPNLRPTKLSLKEVIEVLQK